jgi:hypothetical protein
MATSRMSIGKRIFTIAVAIPTGIVTAFGLGALGWKAAIAFGGVKQDIAAIRMTTEIDALKKSNDDLRKQIDTFRIQNGALENRISIATSQPTDNDWETTNYRLIEMYADLIEADHALVGKSVVLMGNMLKMTDIESKAVADILKACQQIEKRKANFNAIMVGARLMASKTIDGKEFVYLIKYPRYAVNWETGQLKDLGK